MDTTYLINGHIEKDASVNFLYSVTLVSYLYVFENYFICELRNIKMFSAELTDFRILYNVFRSIAIKDVSYNLMYLSILIHE